MNVFDAVNNIIPQANGGSKVRELTKDGIDLIKSFESCVLKAYADPASPLATQLRKAADKRSKGWQALSGEPWTVGWGSTGLDYFNLGADGKPTKIGPNTVWSQAQADSRHVADLEMFCKAVDRLVTAKISNNQYSALVSFAYNCGVGNLTSSTLLKRVNEGKLQEAANEFLKWDKAQGKVMAGLTRRREAEKALFLK